MEPTTSLTPLKHLFQNDGEPLTLFEDYQPQTIAQMVRLGRTLLYMDAGLGKTVCGLKMIEELQPESIIIVAPRKAIIGWLRMLRDWYPTAFKSFRFILDNNQAARKAKWATCSPYVITTWNILQRDDKFIRRRNYHMVMADEVHKVMRSRKTKSRNALNRLHCVYMCLLSGSPIAGRHGGEWWTYINLLNPRHFPSYWKFVNMFAHVTEGYFGKDIYGVRNPEGLQRVLRQHVVTVLKKDLGRQRKVRGFLDVEMTDPQRAVYEELRDNMYSIFNSESGSGSIITTTVLERLTRLRQLLACPAMFGEEALGYGGAVEYLCEYLTDLPVEQRHCVVYTPFRGAVPAIKRALIAAGLGTDETINIFMGGMFDEKSLAVHLDKWKAGHATGSIAVATIQFAESYDMETTDKAFFIGYEWDPQVNSQAEDRIDRVVNKRSVLNMHYFRYANTVDDDVMGQIVMKQQNLTFMLKDPKRLSFLVRKREADSFSNEGI